MNLAQQKLLDLILFIDKVANANHLNYWLDGGTLLGAKRHGGFIPWDNDIDICLLKSDFDLLIKHLKIACENHDSYYVYRNGSLNYWSNNLADISVTENGVIPIKIDIIPMFCFDNKLQFDAYKEKLNIAGYYIYGKEKHPSPQTDNTISEIKKENTLDIKSKNTYFEYFNNAFKNSNNKAPYITYSFHDLMVTKKRITYNGDILFPLKKVKFENHDLPAPQNTDAYLEVLYGKNFMTPPPLDKQKPKGTTYTVNNRTKNKTRQLTDLFLEREYYLHKARMANSKLGRYGLKFNFYFRTALKSIKKGVPLYIYHQIKYSLLRELNQ